VPLRSGLRLELVDRLLWYYEQHSATTVETEYGRFADKTLRQQTLRRQCRTDPREDVGEDVGVVECGLHAIVCVGQTSDIVGVTSCRRNVRTPSRRDSAKPSLVTVALVR